MIYDILLQDFINFAGCLHPVNNVLNALLNSH